MDELRAVALPRQAVQPDRGERRFARLRAGPSAPLTSTVRLFPLSRERSADRNRKSAPTPAAPIFDDASTLMRLYGPRWCLLRGLLLPATGPHRIGP